MSYNIDHIEYLSGKLTISRKVTGKLKRKYAREMAEGNFLDEIDEDADGPDDAPIEKLWWYGEGSDHSYDLFKTLLQSTKGTAVILLVWEGGDSQTALAIADGVVTEKKVKTVIE